ncbi:glycosyl hydrolase family 81 [Phlyctema vagabunda]|uniref:glucan endo-1,3-beta-D-glucosidase n=1 Tax=Phlyctema vagabunda TaxID=108571 RepID=A0ABR4PKG4_9HELO
MKPLILLTILQALTVIAIPHRHRKRQVCEVSSIRNSNTFATASAPSRTTLGNPTKTRVSVTTSLKPTTTARNSQTPVATRGSNTSVQPIPASTPRSTVIATQPSTPQQTNRPAVSQPGVGTAAPQPAATGPERWPIIPEPVSVPAGDPISPIVDRPVPNQAASQPSQQTVSPITTEPASDEGCPAPASSAIKPTLPQNTSPATQAPVSERPATIIPTSAGGIFFGSISTSKVTPKVSVFTTSRTSGIVQVLPSLTTRVPATVGTVITSLQTSGAATSGPLIKTSISSPRSLISVTAAASSVKTSVKPSMTSQNIFQPIATDAPPSVVASRSDHPVPRLSIAAQRLPISTNKFYSNFFLGSQSAASFTQPYSVSWSKGGGSSGSWGMSIQHIDSNQKVFGPDASANPVQYFINPIGIQSIVLSAVELGSSTKLSTDSVTAFSANVNLAPSAGAAPTITFPLVQGMGFVTGIFNGGTPILQTGVFFRTVTRVTTSPKAGVTKYRIILEDGKTWLLYAWSPSGAALELKVVSNGLVQATSNFIGTIQIAKNPGGVAEALYDAASGAYATTATLSGSVNGAQGSYTLSFTKGGIAGTTLIMFALPHHVQSFAATTKSAVTTVTLNTTTKGIATAVRADAWTLAENLPITMGFAPWSPSLGSQTALSASEKATILNIATSEVSQDMGAQSNLNSMYYSGKALAKFAQIVYTINDLLENKSLAQAGLAKLKTAFAVFTSNKQQYPLVRETAWGGVVSSASYVTGDSGADFGNSYYNDHHFHYGYFVYAAAIIGYLDPSWLTTGNNKAYINMLVRDFANPSTADTYFPVSRSFDWYNGHSWAKGLYESYDGKDQESSSEDSMSAYAIKLWGRTIGDSNMEARGNLQLAVTARSLQNYFLYTSDNTVQPANFIGNKVSGILFENKIDHTTYFGANIEYIQGIHMLPLLPASTLTRSTRFVTEEWNAFFSSGRAEKVVGGWKGVLFANLAIIQPTTAWNFFAASNFDASWLDGGASRTWYLALAAGWGN